MKGTLKLLPADKPVEGMQIILKDKIDHIKVYPFDNQATDKDNYGYDIILERKGVQLILDLKQIVIEYETLDSFRTDVYNRIKEDTIKHRKEILPLYPEDWQKALSLIGQEVEFETFEFYPRHKTLKGAKLILPKQEENWDDIYARYDNETPINSVYQEWLKENYLPPKRLK